MSTSQVKDLHDGNPDGVYIGASTSQKVGLWGKTPVVQPAAAGQSAVATAAITSIGSTSLTATDVTRIHALNDRVTALSLLVDNMRTAMVNSGVMKGSA